MCIKILHFKQGLKQTTVVIACTVVVSICMYDLHKIYIVIAKGYLKYINVR